MKEESEKVGLKLNIQKTRILASGPITSWQIDGETVETVADFIFWGSKITVDRDCSHEITRCLFLGRKVITNLESILKSRDFANKGLSSQSYGFSSRQLWMWELDYKECWMSKNWCFWTVVLEKILESPLDCKEIQPVHPKGNKSWIFIGRTGAEAETPIFGYLMRITDSFEKTLIWRKIEGGRRRGRQEDEMAGWHHRLNEWTWVWVNSGSWWWTGRPGTLRFTGSQGVRHDWATELSCTALFCLFPPLF